MKVLLLAAPYDSGHYKKRLGLGPLALLYGIESKLKRKGYTVRKEEVFITTTFPTEIITSFAVSRKIAGHVKEAKAKGEFPIILSGNCNAAIGTLSGLEDKSGVIWFDCHGDFNTPETTIGGFLDGMALSMVTGHCWVQLTTSIPGFKAVEEEKVILIGARDFDPLEIKRLSSSPITLVTSEMLKQNPYTLRENIVSMESVYLHIDLDVIDPKYVKANTYSTKGGLLPEELYKAVDLIKQHYRIAAMAFTAYDPSLDPENKMQEIVSTIVDIII